MRLPFSRKNRHHLRLVPDHPVVVDAEWLDRNIEFDWECGGERAVKQFLKWASPGIILPGFAADPFCLVPIFEEAKPQIERVFECNATRLDRLDFCTATAVEQLAAWSGAGEKTDELALPRAVAIALVLGVKDENRELLMKLMMYGDIGVAFGFQAATRLASLRPDGRLTRAELALWEYHVLNAMNAMSKSAFLNAIKTILEPIERERIAQAS